VSEGSPRRVVSRIAGQLAGYLAGVILPWISSLLVLRLGVLRGFPFALQFLTIAAIGRYWGLGPSLLAVISSAVAFNFVVMPPAFGWALDREGMVRTALVSIAGLVACAFSQQRSRAERERDRALETLRERTAALTEAQRGSRAAAWVFSVWDRTTRFYPGGADLFGIPLEEVSKIGSPTSLVLDEDRPRVELAALRTARTGEPFNVDFRVVWPNGEVHWLETRGIPMPDDPMTWRGVTIDITERKMTELALLRAEKLAAVGRLASTLAHEINNPLEAVTNLLYLAQTDPATSPAARSYLQLADQELARLAGITRLTLNFVRTNRPLGPCDLAEVAMSVVALFRAKCESRGIHLECEPVPGITVAIPPDELRQILTNLISNASDAFQGSDASAGRPGGQIDILLERGAHVGVVTVRDNGMGIAAENLGKIFDPFFTTKEDVGTGIGLWVTKELVEKHAGRVSVESDERADGCRTRFRVELPLTECD